MREYFCIDRFEEGYAVCQREDRSSLLVERERLPAGAREGDCFYEADNGRLLVDQEETERRRQQAFRLLSQLKKRPR